MTFEMQHEICGIIIFVALMLFVAMLVATGIWATAITIRVLIEDYREEKQAKKQSNT